MDFDNKNDLRSEMRQLNRELQTLNSFHHAAILRFIGFSPVNFDNELCPSIITEYHERGSLRNFIHNENQALSNTQKLIILYGIASGMSFLHQHDYIHRDLKPENILLNSKFCPILADFGLSKFINQDNDSTRSTISVKGSPAYIAPEIFERNEYTKEGDVYSFSIIIYELITNLIPYEGKTSDEIKEAVMSGKQLKFPREYQRSPFRSLFMNCHQREPNHRPSFSDIVTLLETDAKFLQGVNEDQYREYIKSVKDYGEQFDTNNEKVKFDDFLEFQQRHQASNDAVPVFSPRCMRMIFEAGLDPQKMLQIGQNIYDGKEGFSRNRQYGNRYIKNSADLGYIEGILLYAEHMGKEQKYEESATYYHKAAVQGNAYGEFKYGQILIEGKGVPEDKAKGLEYLSKSMKQGLPEAESLYKMYNNE